MLVIVSGVTVVVLTTIVFRTTFDDLIVVEPISVPKSLVDKGITSGVATQRVIDGIYVIDQGAKTAKQRPRFGSESPFAEVATIQMPASAFTVQSIVVLLRNFFGLTQSKISGELTIKRQAGIFAPEQFEILLRFDRPKRRTVLVASAGSVDEIFSLASYKIVEQLDPYVLAAYFYHQKRWSEALPLVRRLLESGDRDLAKWALNLGALHLNDDNQFERAIRFLEYAQDKGSGSFEVSTVNMASVYFNLANQLRREGRYQEAVQALRKATEMKADFPDAYLALGALQFTNDDVDGAIESFDKVTRIDPQNADAYFLWGRVLLVVGDLNGAMDKYRMAMTVDRRKRHSCLGDAIREIREARDRQSELIKKLTLPQVIGYLLRSSDCRTRLTIEAVDGPWKNLD